MNAMRQSLNGMVEDAYRFFDGWNKLAGILIIIVIAYTFTPGAESRIPISTTEALLLVTTVYAFAAFNQMRETRLNRKQTAGMSMRPTFSNDSLKLKNFGIGPAHDIRLRVILRDDETKYREVDLIKESDTIHLEEGENFDILTTELSDLADSESQVYEDIEEKVLEFYYTWTGRSGKHYPAEGEANDPMIEVVNSHPEPRCVTLRELHKKISS